MTDFARYSHYVPQSYLGAWAHEPGRIWAYRTLVPAAAYPVWEDRSIRSTVVRQDLYTSVAGGVESDRVERWLNEEVETPALPVLEKLRQVGQLVREERVTLARFLIALEMRTPASYMEQMLRLSDAVDGQMLEAVFDRASKDLAKRDVASVEEVISSPPPAGGIRVKVELEDHPDEPNMKEVNLTVTFGRQHWVETIERGVNAWAPKVADQDWRVLTPHGDWEWPTSDHPFLRLNYYEHGKFDFQGGWQRTGSELLLPLSPRHLLYAKVGGSPVADGVLTLDHTIGIQRLIAARAHRWVFGRRRPLRISWFRPRLVDQEQFRSEEDDWDRWHESQSRADRSGP